MRSKARGGVVLPAVVMVAGRVSGCEANWERPVDAARLQGKSFEEAALPVNGDGREGLRRSFRWWLADGVGRAFG